MVELYPILPLETGTQVAHMCRYALPEGWVEGRELRRGTTRCVVSERPSWRLVIRFKWYVWLLALVPGLAVIVAALTGILDSSFLDTRASVILSGLALTFGALAVLGVLSRPWRVTSFWQRIVAIGGTALAVLAAVVVASAAFGAIQDELFATTVQGVRGVVLFDSGLIAVGTDEAGHVAVWVSPDGELRQPRLRAVTSREGI